MSFTFTDTYDTGESLGKYSHEMDVVSHKYIK
jgi:hypothetical protein